MESKVVLTINSSQELMGVVGLVLRHLNTETLLNVVWLEPPQFLEMQLLCKLQMRQIIVIMFLLYGSLKQPPPLLEEEHEGFGVFAILILILPMDKYLVEQTMLPGSRLWS